MRTTSAPSCANVIPANGTATKLEISTTRTPANGRPDDSDSGTADGVTRRVWLALQHRCRDAEAEQEQNHQNPSRTLPDHPDALGSPHLVGAQQLPTAPTKRIPGTMNAAITECHTAIAANAAAANAITAKT